MVDLIQKQDLGTDFTNNNSLVAGGIGINKVALSTVAAGAPVAAPAANAPVDWYDSSVTPYAHYHYSGGVWHLVGDGVGAGGGATNLAYVAAPAQGTVTSDTGNDAVIPLATAANAGLMRPITNVAGHVMRADGTFGAPPEATVSSDNTIDGTGTVASPLTVPVSADAGNTLTLGTDGRLLVPTSVATVTLVKKGAPILITASGAYVPSGVDVVAINVEVQGGGGGGGGAESTASGDADGGSGGAAGGYSQAFIWAPTAGAIVIGAGGAGGVGPASGTAGANTTYTGDGFNIVAEGGGGGDNPPFGTAATDRAGLRAAVSAYGGAASGGHVNVAGKDSGRINVYGTGLGLQGYGGGTPGASTTFGDGGGTGGTGGYYFNGSMKGGASGAAPLAGAYGAGGGGARAHGNHGQENGGAGAAGVVRIQEYTA